MAAHQESQFASAQRMYRSRAADYDASWHPDYTKRFMAIADCQPGERVLSLACGTGLEIEVAAPIVGDAGAVVGVDATEAMLEVARKKQRQGGDDGVWVRRVTLVRHDATDLRGCPGVEVGGFDVILCSNAFVLFDKPAHVVAHWRDRLKPGGRMVIDIADEHNMRQGLMLERVAARLGVPFPPNRSWIKDRQSFSGMLESAGLVVERIETLEKEVGKRATYYSAADADAQFDYVTGMPLTEITATEEFREKAKPLFREEWEAAAVDGQVEVTDTLYVYVARKRE